MILKEKICKHCNGKGTILVSGSEIDCPKCSGAGIVDA